MTQLNKKFNLPEIQKIMMEFEKQSEMMDMKEEMMNDAIDGAMEDADDEDETDEIVNKVLEEIGINMEAQVLDCVCRAVLCFDSHRFNLLCRCRWESRRPHPWSRLRPERRPIWMRSCRPDWIICVASKQLCVLLCFLLFFSSSFPCSVFFLLSFLGLFFLHFLSKKKKKKTEE